MTVMKYYARCHGSSGSAAHLGGPGPGESTNCSAWCEPHQQILSPSCLCVIKNRTSCCVAVVYLSTPVMNSPARPTQPSREVLHLLLLLFRISLGFNPGIARSLPRPPIALSCLYAQTTPHFTARARDRVPDAHVPRGHFPTSSHISEKVLRTVQVRPQHLPSSVGRCTNSLAFSARWSHASMRLEDFPSFLVAAVLCSVPTALAILAPRSRGELVFHCWRGGRSKLTVSV